MNVFNVKDDLLNDIKFDDRINLDNDFLEFQKKENKDKDIDKKVNSNEEVEKETGIVTPHKNPQSP